MFASKCVLCHSAGTPTGVDLSKPFDPEVGIVNRGNSWAANGARQTLIVDPGNVENSSLITKVAETELDPEVDGAPMPLQVPRLTDEELAAVETWILDGARDDEFFAENVAPVFGTEVTLGSRAGKCTWCHHAEADLYIDVLNVFDPETGLVDADSVYGDKIVVPGDPAASVLMQKLASDDPPGLPMPFHVPRLNEGEVQALIAWIEAGAPDN
jgi:hypothetical protein